MTNDPGNLVSFSTYNGKYKIYVGNGTGLGVTLLEKQAYLHHLQKFN